MLLSGAQILVNCLAEQGVFNIFGYPGASILSVYDALTASSVKHVLAAHEQGACFAAEGYARRSGKAGVVLATSGPGATNLVTGIADDCSLLLDKSGEKISFGTGEVTLKIK